MEVKLKPWDRAEHPELYTKTELKNMKLMPAPGTEHAARVVRPKRFGGDYLLYDINQAVPFERTDAEKEAAALKARKAYQKKKNKKLLAQARSETEAFVMSLRPKIKYRLVVIDFETTGLDPEKDEILQVAIIDQDGKKLMNELCRPVVAETWPEAAAINGITPEMVKDKEPFSALAQRVAKILFSAEMVMAYNDGFEHSFLAGNGLHPEKLTWAPDPMVVYTEMYSDNGRWVSLAKAAAALGYTFKAHDALEDVRATLFVHKVLEEPKLQNVSDDLGRLTWKS